MGYFALGGYALNASVFINRQFVSNNRHILHRHIISYMWLHRLENHLKLITILCVLTLLLGLLLCHYRIFIVSRYALNYINVFNMTEVWNYLPYLVTYFDPLNDVLISLNDLINLLLNIFITSILTVDLNKKLNFWYSSAVVPIIEFLSFVLIYTINHTNLIISIINFKLFHTTLIINKCLNCEQTIMKNILNYYESQRYGKHHD